MIQMVISRAELQRALADLDKAVARGFTDSMAIVKLSQIGEGIDDARLTYTDRIIVQVTDGDPSTHWGNVAMRWLDDYRYENGKFLET